MDEEEDVKRITEVLNKFKNEDKFEDNYEYEEFINYGDISDTEENVECANDEDNYTVPEFQKADLTKLNTYHPRFSLKADEELVINTCQEPDLKSLLLLNRNKNMQLIQLYKDIKDVLIKCQENIVAKQEHIKINKEKSKKRNVKCWDLGAPYFKDKQLFPSPLSADAIRKRQNGELSFYEIAPSAKTNKWTCNETDRLLKAVKCNYNINKEGEIKKNIIAYKKSLALKENPDTREKLKILEDQMKTLDENEKDNIQELPLLNCDKYINWDRISDAFFNDKYSAIECKCLWHLYLHPNINKSPWTTEENDKLKRLVRKYKTQNWEQIAKELGTKRSAFITCLHYFNNVAEKFKKAKFSPEEDEAVLELVNFYRRGSYIPWAKIVHHFKNRSRGQLFYRYQYFLSSMHVKKGKFSEAEDVLLMILVDKFGRNFKKCQEHFPTRSMVQLKARYSSNLSNFVKKGSFTIEEDQQILDHVKDHGQKKWAILTKKIFRCRSQLRQRYRTIVQYLHDNPEAELKHVTRRRHQTMKSSEDSYEFLRFVADKYKNSEAIPTLQDIKNVMKQTRNDVGTEDTEDSGAEDGVDPLSTPVPEIQKPFPKYLPTANIDDMLIDCFSDEFKNTFQTNISNELQDTVNYVKDILNILHVNLRVPLHFKEDPQLDNLDIAILSNFTQTIKTEPMNDEITRLVPPNLNTLVGMTSILHKHVSYKSRMRKKSEGAHIFDDFTKSKSHNQLSWCVSRNLFNMGDAEREMLVNERLLFFKRFISLFKIPALMTLETPSKELLSTSNYYKAESSLQVKRTYSKAMGTGTYSRAKKNKVVKEEDSVNLENAQGASPVTVPKLTKTTDTNLISNLKQQIQNEIESLSAGKKTKSVVKKNIDSAQPTIMKKNIARNSNKHKIPRTTTIRNQTIDHKLVVGTNKKNKRSNADTTCSTISNENNIINRIKKNIPPTDSSNVGRADSEVKTSARNKSYYVGTNCDASKIEQHRGNTTFDMRKGELVIENNDNDSVMDDLEDLKALSLFLKKASDSNSQEDEVC